MKHLLAFASVGFLAFSGAAFAQSSSTETPGHEMQENGPAKGSPGASDYAPGHEKGLTEGRSSATDADRDRDDATRKGSSGGMTRDKNTSTSKMK